MVKFCRILFCVLCVTKLIVAKERPNGRGIFGFLFDSCSCRCGLPNRAGRILGGEYLQVHEFPWLAVINIRGISRGVGTLINNKYILTSSSLLLGLTPHEIKVTLGQFDRCYPDTSSINISVERIVLHSDFNPGNRAHDIALLRLSSPVIFEKKISPVCLAHPGTKYVGQVSTIVGWPVGPTVDVQDMSTCRPKKLGLPILDSLQCLSSNPDFSGPDKGCVGILGNPSVICESDGGGPVLYRTYGGVYELIGVLTDKNNCNQEPNVSIYTAVNKHLSWITQNTKDACYCYKT